MKHDIKKFTDVTRILVQAKNRSNYSLESEEKRLKKFVNSPEFQGESKEALEARDEFKSSLRSSLEDLFDYLLDANQKKTLVFDFYEIDRYAEDVFDADTYDFLYYVRLYLAYAEIRDLFKDSDLSIKFEDVLELYHENEHLYPSYI